MATLTAGSLGVDFDLLDLGPLAGATQSAATPTSVSLSISGVTAQIFGSGFTYGSSGPPSTGTIQRIVVSVDAGLAYDIAGLNVSSAAFRGWVSAGDNAAAKAGLFVGDDQFVGSPAADRLYAYAGNDTVGGGQGADTIVEQSGSNYLRGDEGDDQITGGSGFDDINGNMGNDTASGGLGDDWVVGGKDNDRLFGEDGGDLVYGNLGDDYCDGGAGNDTIRGGQQNDSLSGGGGDDFVSGDRGDDTMTGGPGADMFHSSADAGVDRVIDFNVNEGDRVLLDPGTTYSVAQVGGDTVITMSAGQVILAGVSMSTLIASTIIVG
ncbi:calcium-binding protein [Phenylobacterium sp.]|uniref:calcium-binding protein n=1 Tax=Phenylobacterium sp. TaxID=1871053 RepID=UPI0025DEA834|nr:calcium-binding protein [Phenylobacterium sp.]